MSSSRSSVTDTRDKTQDMDDMDEIEFLPQQPPTTTTTTTSNNNPPKRTKVVAEFTTLFKHGDGRKVTCKLCLGNGVNPAACTGMHLSEYGVRHSEREHANHEEHQPSREAFLQKNNTRKKRAQTSTTTSTSSSMMESFLESSKTNVSKDDVKDAVIEFFVSNRLAFNLAEPLQKLLNTTCAYGAQSHYTNIDITQRKALVERYERSFLPGIVKNIKEKHLSAMERSGAQLSFDSARDVNSRSVCILLASTTEGFFPIATPIAGAERKTAQYTFTMLDKIVTGKYNVFEQDIIAAPDNASVRELSSVKLLNELASCVGEFVWGANSDHGLPEQGGLRLLREKLGVIDVGDGGHAAHRCCERVIKLFGDELKEINDVNDFIRSHSYLKESIRKKGVVLTANASTRFLVTYLVCNKLDVGKNVICDTIAVSDYDDWLKTQDGEIQSRGKIIKNVVAKASFWQNVQKIRDLCLPFVKFCRFFDASDPRNICFIYRYFSLLAESIKVELGKHKVDKAKCDEIFTSLTKSWRYFHRDVYSFAFALSPAHLSDIQQMKRENTEEFAEIRDDVINVATDMIRRFAPTSMKARPIILAADNSEVKEILKKFMDDFDLYVDGSEKRLQFENTDWSGDQIWRIRGSSSVIALYAARVLAGSASDATNERANYRLSRLRTGPRNLTGYVRAQGFLLGDMYLNKVESTGRTWKELWQQYQTFTMASDEDEQYIIEYENRVAATKAAREEEIEARNEQGLEDTVAVPNAADNVVVSQAAVVARRVRRKHLAKVLAEYIESDESDNDDDSDEDYDDGD
jgi:hypothetical protein